MVGKVLPSCSAPCGRPDESCLQVAHCGHCSGRVRDLRGGWHNVRIGAPCLRPAVGVFHHLLFWELISPILGASELALLAYNLTLEWITTLDAIEFARTSNESLCTVRRSLARRKLCVPFREYIVLPIGPGTFAPKGDRISIDVTNIRTVCRFYMQRIVLCYDSINDAVT